MGPPRVPGRLPEGLLLCAVVFGPLAFGATEPWSAAILEGLLFAMAFLCALSGLPDRAHPAYRTLLPAAGFIFVIGLLQYLNPRPAAAPASLLPFTVAKGETGRAAVLWGAYAALLLGAPRVLSSRAALRRFLWTVFALGSAIAVIGLVQNGLGNTAYYGLRPVRHGAPFGPYTNRNHAASLLGLAAFSGAGLWLSRLQAIRRLESLGERIEAWSAQALIAFFLGVILFAGLQIRSRGAILSMVLTAGLMGAASLWHLKSGAKRLLAALLLAAAAAAFLGAVSVDRSWLGLELSTAPISSAPYRLALYRNSFEVVRDFPLFGTGLATYRHIFPSYQNARLFEGVVEHAHNDWLELLIQTGFAGLAAYLAAVLAALALAARAWLASPSSELRCLGGACLAAVLFFSLHSLADFSFQIPANAVLCLTFLVGLASFSASSFSLREPRI